MLWNWIEKKWELRKKYLKSWYILNKTNKNNNLADFFAVQKLEKFRKWLRARSTGLEKKSTKCVVNQFGIADSCLKIESFVFCVVVRDLISPASAPLGGSCEIFVVSTKLCTSCRPIVDFVGSPAEICRLVQPVWEANFYFCPLWIILLNSKCKKNRYCISK